MEDDKVASSLGTGWIKDLRDWVDILFKSVLAVVGVLVGYYFSFEKQQNDDIQMIVGMATDASKTKQAMSGPIAKAYFDQKRIPLEVYVAIYSYANLAPGGDDGDQQTVVNTLIASSASSDSDLEKALERASASLPVRVYLKVRQQADKARTEAVRSELRTATLPNSQPILVPPAQVMPGDSGDGSRTTLKCFRQKECDTLGKTIVAMLVSYGLSITLDDQTKFYKQTPTVRPNVFEIWFAKNFTA